LNYPDRPREQRVAIVDYDVHHGNGTQEAFYTDPDCLFIAFRTAIIHLVVDLSMKLVLKVQKVAISIFHFLLAVVSEPISMPLKLSLFQHFIAFVLT
jgi:hypothetical protein